MDKKTILDILICVALVVVIIVEIVFGFNLLKNKWAADVNLVISKSMDYGQQLGLIETVFSWPSVEEPSLSGDVVEIDENRFRINGVLTDDNKNSKGYVYYASYPSNESQYLQYEEILDTEKLILLQQAYIDYFNGTADALLPLLNVTVESANVTAYQQNFTEGVIPIFYDNGSEKYYMVLNCTSSYYVLSCKEPFVLTDAKVSVHYGDIASDPLKEHSWSTYEAGAIDNTRQKLMNSDSTLESYTQSNVGEVYTDVAGNSYTQQNTVVDNQALYMTQADEDKRARLVEYGRHEYNTDGTYKEGTGSIDITSATAKASEWVFTQSQYSFTNNGITINGLTGDRTPEVLTISGNATNIVDSIRPWVLCAKFLNDKGELLAVKVLDNRSNPIPASGTSYFTVEVKADESVDIKSITCVQFEAH